MCQLKPETNVADQDLAALLLGNTAGEQSNTLKTLSVAFPTSVLMRGSELGAGGVS